MYANIRLWWQSFEKHKKEPNHLHSALEILVNQYQKNKEMVSKFPVIMNLQALLSGQNLSPPLNSKGLRASGQFRAYLKDRMHNLFSQAPSLSCEHNRSAQVKKQKCLKWIEGLLLCIKRVRQVEQICWFSFPTYEPQEKNTSYFPL